MKKRYLIFFIQLILSAAILLVMLIMKYFTPNLYGEFAERYRDMAEDSIIIDQRTISK
ncbi:MAG: hypothetical protein IIZ59_01275 [Clostridia bacterium]|nr:hypothetical protein [Clostridia bacterium]